MPSYFLRRRKYLVNPRFQLLLAAKAVVLVFLFSGVLIYSSAMTTAETIYILPFSCLTPEVKERVLALPREAIWLCLLIALVVALQAILVSHRIAGPSFRFNRIMREMAAGKYPQSVTLRKGDCLTDLAESLTFLGQELQGRRQALLGELAQLHAAVEECTMQPGGGVYPEAVRARLEGLARQICILKQLVQGEAGSGTMNQTLPDPGSARVDTASVPVSSGGA